MSKRAIIPLSYWAEQEKHFMTPAEVAGVLGCDTYKISVMAMTEEGRKDLGFPVIRLGTRTKIPRIPFLRYMGWEGEIKGASA